MTRVVLLVLLPGAFASAPALAQIPIGPGGLVSENFSSLGENAAATLPTAWKVDKSTTVRAAGSYSAALTVTERLGGANLTASAGNGIYNFGSSATDRAVGGLSSSSASKSVNLYVALQNTNGVDIPSLTISYSAERYRNGSNAAGFSIQLYYSTDGATWTSAGPNFLSSFAANADNNGSATVPMQTIAVASQPLPVSVPAGSTLYLAWNYSVTAGSTTSNAQALGVTDIQIAAGGSAGSGPVISTFAPTSGFLGDSVTINGSNFGSSPTVKFNGTTATSVSVNPAGTQITATVPSGASTGKITVEVVGEPIATSATDFTVIAPGTPIINLSTNAITGLRTSTGSPSSATNYVVSGTNLGATPVTVTPDSALLEVGTNGADFASSASLNPSGGTVSNTIFLRVVATNVVTNFTAVVNHISGTASNALTVGGSITNPAPSLVLNPTNLSGFTTTTNTPSANQSFTVVGSNLTTDVSITAPGGFEVANDASTWGTNTSLAQIGGSASGTISVRMSALSASGPRFGTVLVGSSGLTNRVTVNGSVPVPSVPGQIYWNFDTDTPTSGTGGDYSSWTFPAITQNNNNGTTALLTTTSASSGYTNPFNVLASGTTNAGASARVGVFNASTNAFFEVQIVVPTSTTASITNISFGSRSTGTGPAAYSIRSSVDGFASDVVTNALTTNSVWGMYVAPVSIALSNGTNTIRIYGYGSAAASSTAGTANWRIDDLTLAVLSDPNAPAINVAPFSLTNFTAVQGSESASQQLIVTGSNLGGSNITVTSSNNFYVVSTNAFATAGVNSLTLAPTGGVLAVRIASNAPVTNNLLGNLSLSGGGATNNVSLRGIVAGPNAPSITVSTNSLPAFSSTTNVASAAQSFFAQGTNLSANITVTAPTGFSVGFTSNNADFGTSVTLINSAGIATNREIFVRMNASAVTNALSARNVTVASAGATTQNVTVSGTVATPNAPSLSVSPASLTNFVTTAGTASAAKTFTVTGTNLQGDVVVAPPTGYQVSLDGNSWTSTLTVPRAYNAFDDFYVNVPATGGNSNYTQATWIANAGTVPFDTGLTNANTWGYAGGNFNGVGAPSSVGTYVSGGNFYPLTSGGSLAGPGASYDLGGGNFWIGYNDQYAVATPGQTQIGKYTKEWFAGSPNHTGNPDGTNNKFLWLQGTGLQSSTDGLGAILTWTAPNAGTFTFNGSYVNGNYGPSTSFAIVDSLNNTNLAKQTLAPSSSTNSFSFTRTYSAGDVVQFQVGTPVASQGSPLGLSVEVTPALAISRVVYVRIAPSASAGPLAGNVSVTSASADTQLVTISGTVNPAPPSSLTVTGILTNFSTVQGVASATQSFVVQGGGLTSNVTVSAPANLQFTTNTNNPASYVASLVLPISGGALSTTVFARIPDTAAIGGPTTNVITANSGATNVALNAVTTVSSNTSPFILADPTSLSGFSTTEGTPSTNIQTFTVGGTNLTGNLNIAAPLGYQVSTNGIDFVSSLSLVPVGGTPVLTNLAIDDANNYTSATWTNGANGGTGFGAWTITSTNGTGGFGGVFIGNPTAAGITTNATFGTNAFGMYANPGTSGAFANVDRTFAALQNGQTFSFQWAVNWDSDVGNKGFSLYAGGPSGTQILNVNQAGFPGDIRFIGGGVTNNNIGLPFGTGPMTWSFAMTSPTNLSVASTGRDGGTNIAFSTNIAVTAGPDSFRWYVSAMGAGDQRQQYYNNLKIVGTTASGNVSPTTIYVRLSGATAGSAGGNIDLTGSGAPPKTVALSGTVLPRPAITPIASLAPFAADLGTPSAAQSFTFVGTNLVGDVTLTAPAGYEISKTTNGTYSDILTYAVSEAQPGPATNWVRLATNAPAGFVFGNVSLASQGAGTTNVSVAGRVVGPAAIVVAPTNLTNFFAPLGAPSEPQSFTVSGVDLRGDIQLAVAPSVGWEISLSKSNGYTNTLSLATNAPVVNPVLASDSAANYGGAGEPLWETGSNAGSGFGAWTNFISSGAGSFAGTFLGAVPSLTNLAALYTDGQGFGLYADNAGGTGAAATSERAVAQRLNVGDSLRASIGFCFAAGNRGFTVSGGGGEVFFFDINDGGFSWTGGGSAPLTAFAGLREFGQVINFSITRTATGFDYAFSSPQDAGLTQSGSVAAPVGPDSFKFYVTGAGGGDQNNFFFNNLQVVRRNAGPVVEPTTIYARIKAGAPVTPPGGSYVGAVTATSTGATSRTVALEGIVSDKPEITRSAAPLALFLAVQGFPSDPQTFTVGGNNLEAGVLVTPPTGYQVSLDGIAWLPSVTVARTGLITPQQTIHIRIASTTPVGTPGGNILLTSTNAPSVTIPVTGRVDANSGPQLTAAPTALSVFSTDLGTESSAQSFALTGQGLSAAVEMIAPSGYEISTNGTTFVSNSTIAPAASGFISNTVSVRMAGTALGIFGGGVTATSGAANASVAVQGTVFAVGAQIAASPTNLSGFTTVSGTPSDTQLFQAAARNLGTTPLVITSSTGYQISTNSTDFFTNSLSLVPVAGTVGPIPVYVRIAANAPVTVNLAGTNTVSSAGTTPVDIELNGKVDPLRPPTVTLVAPSNNPTIIAPGSSIRLRATATDTDVSGGQGTLATFEFLTNGVSVPGAITNNVLSPASLQFDWTPSLTDLPAIVSARAVDTDGLTGISTSSVTVRFPEPGEPVIGFTPPVPFPTTSQIEAVAPATNAAFYVGGSFTNFVRTVDSVAVTNAATRVARILADGTVDPEFITETGPNNTVRTLLYSATDQGLYVGGIFTNVSGVARPGLARLTVGQTNIDDGTLDTNFAPALAGGTAPIVNAIVQQYDGKILVGGIFATAGAATNAANSANLARFFANGLRDTSFNPPAPNGEVKSIALQPDGKILIAGSFAQVAGQERRGIARLNVDGTLDTMFTVGTGPTGGFNGAVWSVAVALDGSIYAGGQFSSFNGRSVYNNLAKLSPTGVLQTRFNFAGSLAGGINNLVRNVQMRPDGNILVSGLFTQIGNSVLFPTPQPVGRFAEFLPDGNLDTTFNPGGTGANNSVLNAATLADGNLVLVGAFSTFNGQPRARMVVLTGFPAADPVVTSPSFVTVDAGSDLDLALTHSAGTAFVDPAAALPRGVKFDPAIGKLYGIPLDAGAYDLSLAAAMPRGATGTPSNFRLQVLPKTVPYETWKRVWFTPLEQTNSAISGPAVSVGNPSGQPNFTVYALSGGDPRKEGASILPAAAPTIFEGQRYMGYTVWRYPRAAASYSVQASTDLTAWDEQTVILTNTPNFFQVRPTVPIPQAKSQFFRLKISDP